MLLLLGSCDIFETEIRIYLRDISWSFNKISSPFPMGGYPWFLQPRLKIHT